MDLKKVDVISFQSRKTFLEGAADVLGISDIDFGSQKDV